MSFLKFKYTTYYYSYDKTNNRYTTKCWESSTFTVNVFLRLLMMNRYG